MNDEIKQQVIEYVYTNYKTHKNKQLIIKEMDSCFHILIHKDGSPLILGKSILN